MPKLLTPVRDETSLTATIKAGVNALYFGVDMKISSKGIDLDKLPELVEKTHKAKVDAVICHDKEDTFSYINPSKCIKFCFCKKERLYCNPLQFQPMYRR